MTLERQWQALYAERCRLNTVLDQLRKQLNRLSEQPDIHELLKEMTRLRKKEIPALQEEIAQCDAAIARMEELLKERRHAGSGTTWRRVRERRRKAEQQRLADLLRRGSPEPRIQEARRVIRNLETSIEEMEEDFRALRAEEERRREDAWKKINDAEDLIADIQDHYRSVRRTLEHDIRDAEDQRTRQMSVEQEWCTRTRDHVEYAVAQQPASADDLLQRYYRRFPEEAPVVLPIAASAPRTWKKWRRSSGRSEGPQPAVIRDEKQRNDAPWTLRLTFHPDKPGLRLPTGQSACLQLLRETLTAKRCDNFAPELVLHKVQAFTGMTLQQRQQLKRVLGQHLHGWRIVRLGRARRILLWIDEDAREVRFLLRLRRIAYG